MLRKDEAVLFRLAGAMGFCPHAGQISVMKAFVTHRFIALSCGRRWGKTKIVSLLVDYGLMEKNCRILCVSKTYKLAKKLWNYVYPDVRNLYGPGVFRINKSEMIMESPWGSSLELGSADNPDSILGDAYDIVIDDEAATMLEKIFQQNLLPMIRDRKGTLICISTPRGHNWFYRIFKLGQRHEQGWWSRTGHSFENTAVYDEAEQRLVKEQTDPLYFEQEYAASFIVFADQVYPDFREETHVIAEADKPDFNNWDIYVTIDPGYAQMCAIVWVAYSKVSGEMIIIDEVLKKHLKYDPIINEIRKREPKQGYAGFVCDVAGHQRNQDGLAFIQTLEEHEWFQSRDYIIHAKRYGIIRGINKVRAKLLNALGEIHLKVMENCTGVIEMFQNYHYPENKDTEKPEKDGVYDHPADCIRYFIEMIDDYENGSREYDL